MPDSDIHAQRQAEIEARLKALDKTKEVRQENYSMSRVGYDFITSILVSGAMGWAFDAWFQTEPWGLIIMTFVGFGAGIAAVARSLGGYDGAALGWQKKDGKED